MEPYDLSTLVTVLALAALLCAEPIGRVARAVARRAAGRTS